MQLKMGRYKCYVANCPNSLSKNCRKQGTRIYRVSRHAVEQVRQQWIENIPQREDVPFDLDNKAHVICYLHFEDKCIAKEWTCKMPDGTISEIKRVKWGVKQDAVPTIFGKPKRRVLRKRTIVTTGRKVGVIRVSTGDGKGQTGEPLSVISTTDKEESYGKKDHYCCLCLKIWNAEIFNPKSFEINEKVYHTFVRIAAKHLELDLQMDTHLKKQNHDLNTRRLLCRTMCDSCLEDVDVICKLYKELEIAKIKLDNKCVEIRWKLKNKNMPERQRALKRRLGKDGIENLLMFNDSFKDGGNKLAFPQVVLNRKDAQTENRRKENLSGDLKQLQTKSPCINPDNEGFLFGTSAIRDFFSVDKIPICSLCDKTFQTRGDLREHKDLHHSSNVWKPQNTLHQDSTTSSSTTATSCAVKSSRFSNHPQAQTNLAARTRKVFGSDEHPQQRRGQLEDIKCNQNMRSKDGKNTSSNLGSSQEQLQLVLNENLVAQKSSNEQTEDVTSDKIDLMDDPQEVSFCPSPAASDNNDDYSDGNEPFHLIRNKRQTTPETSVNHKGQQSKDVPNLKPHEINDDEDVKPNIEELPKPTPKKVPFMSSEYLGKYKIVCKLKNVTTGETCLGVISKTRALTHGENSKSTTNLLPKVISTQPEEFLEEAHDLPKVSNQKEQKIQKAPKAVPRFPQVSGPPYKCPIDGCSKEFARHITCRKHYYFHYQKLERIRKKIESGEGLAQKKLITKRKKPPKQKQEKIQNETKIADRQRRIADNPFACEHCHCRFDTQEMLDFHIKVHHSPVQCHFCSSIQPNIATLVDHEKTHKESNPANDSPDEFVNKKDYAYLCPRCDEPISSPSARKRYSIIRHYATIHLNIKSPPRKRPKTRLQCNDCNQKFCERESYIRHRLVHHNETIILPVKCSLCDKSYTTVALLNWHTKRVHGPNNIQSRRQVLKCNICSKVYTLRFRYENHMQIHARNESRTGNPKILMSADDPSCPYVCEICGQPFRREWALCQHKKRQHEGEGANLASTQCRICLRDFPTVRKMKIHLGWHRVKEKRLATGGTQPTNRVCHLCGKKWPNNGLLRYHMRRAHPEVEATEYEISPGKGEMCHVCGQVYADKQVLKRHVRRNHE